jgi:hypothetical protein
MTGRTGGVRALLFGRSAPLPRPPAALVAAVAVGIGVQRLALPGVQIPLLVPLAVAAIAVGLQRGMLSFDRARLQLYLVAAAAAVAATVAALLRGLAPSLPSLAILLGIYACGTVVLSAPTWAGYRTLLTAFVRVMTGYAALGTVVFAAQWVGLGYRDWLGAVVPDSMLLQGFRTTNPLVYGQELMRANGVVFLEPSMFSLFTGLALATALYLRAGPLTLAVLFVGLTASVSGNGMVVLAAAVGVLALAGRWVALRPLLVPAVLGAGVAVVFGLLPTLLSRATEVTRTDSSASLRFVQPYGVFLDRLLESPTTLLLGEGAGAADSYVQTVRAADLLAPVVPKILFEYGLVAAIPLVALLCSLFLARVPTWVLGAGLALVYWVINASLLVALLPFTLMVFSTLWAPLRERTLDGAGTPAPGAAPAVDRRPVSR